MNTLIETNHTSSICNAGALNGPQTRSTRKDVYALATGAAAVRRLLVLHDIYAPATRRVLLEAGLGPGMKVADFGCGVGAVTAMLGEMVGPSGSVTGVDISAAQLAQAHMVCRASGLRNTKFIEADACATGLPRGTFDLVYCRFLLLHLPDPAACLREMRDTLAPGGMLLVEDGDLSTATSLPPTATNAFADLFTRLGPTRGLDYRLGSRLHRMVKDAGFSKPTIEVNQPMMTCSHTRYFLKWSVEEASSALVSAGLITFEELEVILCEMRAAAEDPGVVLLPPRMSLVWARK